MSETPNTPRSDEDYILSLLKRIAELSDKLAQAQARIAEVEKAAIPRLYRACNRHEGMPWAFPIVPQPAATIVCPHCEAIDAALKESR